MAELVNLSRFKKQKARAEKRAQADRNAVTHGLTKAERLKTRAETEKARTFLDGHLRQPEQDIRQDGDS